jgi:hypothetical protein
MRRVRRMSAMGSVPGTEDASTAKGAKVRRGYSVGKLVDQSLDSTFLHPLDIEVQQQAEVPDSRR